MRALSSIKKEFQEIFHDRAMLAILLVFPIFIMIFMGSSFRSLEINGLPIGIAGPINSTFSDALLGGLSGSTAFKLQSFDTEADAMTAFRNGQLRAVIVVPETFEESLRQGNGSTVKIIVDNSDIALEQSVLAAMSSVVSASSADITKGYVSGAWEELSELNRTASGLAGNINSTRVQMQQTRVSINSVRGDIRDLDIGALEDNLDSASSDISDLRSMLEDQKAQVRLAGQEQEMFLNDTRIFLENASGALNSSLDSVQSAYLRLENQSESLEGTVASLDASIAGLTAIRDATSDATLKAALQFNIASLESLRGSSVEQIDAAHEEMAELQELNATLLSFKGSLDGYSDIVDMADSGSTSQMEAALDEAGLRLIEVNGSFSEAREEVSDLKDLLSDMDETAGQIDATLDEVLAQIDEFEGLTDSLERTVAEQTSKDPDLIASPLSIDVQNQYERASFVDFIMPQVISVSLLLSCFLLSSITLVREKTRRTVIRALMAPGSLANLVVGKISTIVLLSFVQVGLIIAVALLFFGVKPPGNFIALLLGTAISSLVLSSIGVIIGFFARSESAAIQGCLLLAIPMLFLGNIIFSPDLLPAYTQILQQLLPLAHITSIFRIVLITDGNPVLDITALITYFVLLASILAFILFKRRDITNYQ
ncbi:MAG: ABC transporter permease [Candidatus Micrarchaeota archaeon]